MKRNKFSLSHYKLLTCNMGQLIPIACFEALPGDTIQQATSMLVRVSPLVAPVMHPVRVRIHHWFVPYRLIWEDWEDFITGGEDGTFTATPSYKTYSSAAEGSLDDYFGVPVDSFGYSMDWSSLPHRAYHLIWNNFYRDQDLQTETSISLASGGDSISSTVKNISWEKDYFTTARPWESKGDEVTIPLLDSAPVMGIGKQNQNWTSGSQAVYEKAGANTYTKYQEINDAAGDTSFFVEGDASNNPNIYADLAAATGISISDLRLAMAVQRYQERMGKFGSRYSEYLRYLGVRSSDARLQLPEYLGGGKQVIQFSEVLSMDSGGSDPVGTMRGHGIAAMRSNRYRKFFEEHGIIMSLLSVVPKTIYASGLPRMFSRQVKEDFFQRELQYIGEQEVLNREVYAAHSNPDETFGYQARYDEYRTIPSKIAGEFHSTMNHWHYARIFGSDPALNSSFVSAVPTKRVNADEEADCLYVMANHSIQARRMISKYAQTKTF